MAPTGSDEYGVYWELDAMVHGELHFVVHKGDDKVYRCFFRLCFLFQSCNLLFLFCFHFRSIEFKPMKP